MNSQSIAQNLYKSLNPDFPYKKAERIKLFVMDVDGVLTDGGLYYSEDGYVRKRFDVQDGLAIHMLHTANITPAIITGMSSPSVLARAHSLKIDDYFCGVKDKLACLEMLMTKYSISFDEIAFVGDDWVDIPPMLHVGLALAPDNAQEAVKEAAHFVISKKGGYGAVRSLIHHVLHAQSLLETCFMSYMGSPRNEK